MSADKDNKADLNADVQRGAAMFACRAVNAAGAFRVLRKTANPGGQQALSVYFNGFSCITSRPITKSRDFSLLSPQLKRNAPKTENMTQTGSLCEDIQRALMNTTATSRQTSVTAATQSLTLDIGITRLPTIWLDVPVATDTSRDLLHVQCWQAGSGQAGCSLY